MNKQEKKEVELSAQREFLLHVDDVATKLETFIQRLEKVCSLCEKLKNQANDVQPTK